MPDKQTWFVFRYNHFDPIWRRCWDRDFIDQKRRFISYRAVEEAWIADAIAASEDGVSCFMVECAWVLRHYLERHPEHTETLRRLTREGRFELLGSGENIVDANMIHGELLARNLLLGTLWAESVLGIRPVTGWHSDGFGSSAQMPQIFRQCGYRWLPAMDYKVPDAPYWRGLDGSVLLFSPDSGGVASFAPGQSGAKRRFARKLAMPVSPYRKHPPCEACAGFGCGVCEGRGFPIGERAEFTPPLEKLSAEIGILLLWGEEILPGLHVAADIAALNKNSDEIEARQGIYRDLLPYIDDYLKQVDDPPPHLVSSSVENNPCSTGCYVTRIKVKQAHRAAEHELLSAETWDALLCEGGHAADLRDAWKRMTLSGFHDAITSTHIDEAYDEIQDLLVGIRLTAAQTSLESCSKALRSPVDESEHVYTVFNHMGRSVTTVVPIPIPRDWEHAAAEINGRPISVYERSPDGASIVVSVAALPPLSACSIRLTPDGLPAPSATSREIRQGAITATAGEHGITALSHEELGVVAAGGMCHLGELFLEHDDGDPWATRSLDRERYSLAPYTTLSSIETIGNVTIATYRGCHPSNSDPHRTFDPRVTYLAWEQRLLFRNGLPWIEIQTDVRWYTYGRRLRLAFPSVESTDFGVYEIPYGVIERDRYEGDSTNGGNADGDWPAIHWAGVQTPNYTFAVFNQGTPSYRVEDGCVFVTLLRSPELPYGLLEPDSYATSNLHGMLDHGHHSFRHALSIVSDHWRHNDVVHQAASFNASFAVHQGMLPSPLPRWSPRCAHTLLTATKTAEDGDGMVMRFVEHAGESEIVEIDIPPEFTRWRRCNLLEDPIGEWMPSRPVRFEIRPWEIVSIRFARRQGG